MNVPSTESAGPHEVASERLAARLAEVTRRLAGERWLANARLAVFGAGVVAAFNTGAGDDTGPDTNRIRVDISARVVNELFPMFRPDAAR